MPFLFRIPLILLFIIREESFLLRKDEDKNFCYYFFLIYFKLLVFNLNSAFFVFLNGSTCVLYSSEEQFVLKASNYSITCF